MSFSLLRRFWRDEEGGIIVMTLLLLVAMLIMGGMAVDFMRFESRRVMLQSVSDRAVLAAANLDRSIPPETVVQDYFEKAGMLDTIVGPVKVPSATSTTRTVGVNAQLDLNTFYLRLAGIDTLTAPAQSIATQGVGEVEISLVLDVSGSMYLPAPTPGYRPPGAPELPQTDGQVRRIDLLEDAAVRFVNDMLVPDNKDQVSISLITYSAHVSLGDDIYKALNVNESITGLAPIKTLGSGPNPARCIELDDSAYSQTEFNATATYDQTQSFQTNTWGRGGFTIDGIYAGSTRDSSRSGLDQPLCPLGDQYGIIPISQNKNQLINAIRDLEPTGSTSIFMGLKWGVTLLDPTFRDVVDNMGNNVIDRAFRDTRPADYIGSDSDSRTAKYIVLMTDGYNDKSRRILPEYYDTEYEVEMWSTYNRPYMNWAANRYADNPSAYPEYEKFANFERRYSRVFGGSDVYEYTAADGDALMDTMCDKAKEAGIILFTIALGTELPSDGTIPENTMSKCASEPTSEFYFATEGAALESIFARIADQITALRLSL